MMLKIMLSILKWVSTEQITYICKYVSMFKKKNRTQKFLRNQRASTHQLGTTDIGYTCKLQYHDNQSLEYSVLKYPNQ